MLHSMYGSFYNFDHACDQSPYPRKPLRSLHPAKELGAGQVTLTKDKLQILMDVQHFHPDEVKVKSFPNHILIEGEHEEKEDVHGYISRSFSRRIPLPLDSTFGPLSSELRDDGTLLISLPRVGPKEADEGALVHISRAFGSVVDLLQNSSPPAKDNPPELSGVSLDKHKMMIRIELPNFVRSDICVKAVGDFLIVEGCHHEKEDPRGFISRTFKRKYHLPLNADKENVECEYFLVPGEAKLAVLNISIPRLVKEDGNEIKYNVRLVT